MLLNLQWVRGILLLHAPAAVVFIAVFDVGQEIVTLHFIVAKKNICPKRRVHSLQSIWVCNKCFLLASLGFDITRPGHFSHWK